MNDEVTPQDLEGDRSVVLEVLGQPDRSHASTANFPLEAVLAGQFGAEGVEVVMGSSVARSGHGVSCGSGPGGRKRLHPAGRNRHPVRHLASSLTLEPQTATMDILTQLQSALAGRYAVERELGQGGMATVYLATDERHGRQVAIKVLKPELASALGPDRFLREIRLAAGLQHPHILAVYDSGDADGLLYYVMPFVEGESLRDRLDREQQLPIHDAVILAREVADALAFAHSRGVVHRDIKPENILISGGHAVVADFGIARAVHAAGEEKLTQTGMSIGTPTYMSPEQAMGDESVDGRSDIYSLGCVIYEMLCGQPPFLGPNPMAILARHSMEAVPSLSIVRNTVPPELEDIVYQALAKVPADRYQTAKQLALALSAPLEATTGAHPRATTGVRARRRPSRRRLAWLGLLLIPAAAAAWYAMHALGSGSGNAPSGRDPNNIAVLYFEDKTGGDLQHVAEGFTEALIHELSDVPALHVISSNGVRPYQGTRVSPDSVARALDVGTLVSGTVNGTDSTITLDVSLINAGTGKEISHTRLEQPRRDIAALQDSLSEQLSVFLRKRLGPEVDLRERRTRTRSAEAWETLQRADAEARDADTLLASGDAAAASAAFDRADSMMAAAGERDSRWSAPTVHRAWLAYRRSRIALGPEPGHGRYLDRPRHRIREPCARDRPGRSRCAGGARDASLLALAPQPGAGHPGRAPASSGCRGGPARLRHREPEPGPGPEYAEPPAPRRVEERRGEDHGPAGVRGRPVPQ